MNRESGRACTARLSRVTARGGRWLVGRSVGSIRSALVGRCLVSADIECGSGGGGGGDESGGMEEGWRGGWWSRGRTNE